MKRLHDKVAIVTGGCRGLGRAVVELFAAEGARVYTCSPDEQAGRKTIDEIRRRDADAAVEFIAVDLAEPTSIDVLVNATVQRFGPIALLVNNAAHIELLDSATASPQSLQRALDVNVKAAWLLSRAVLPQMKQLGGGAIVNVGSTHPHQTRTSSFPYNVSKGALLALTKAMAVDFGPVNVRVNAVLPGIIDTVPTAKWLETFADPQAKRIELLETHALRRMPTLEEVARAILFLASAEASGITGVELFVDAGRQIKRL
jgi:NAD(P)-dependent dehydrogenase (short-subunit alcohol dehydrogenase family)